MNTLALVHQDLWVKDTYHNKKLKPLDNIKVVDKVQSNVLHKVETLSNNKCSKRKNQHRREKPLLPPQHHKPTSWVEFSLGGGADIMDPSYYVQQLPSVVYSETCVDASHYRREDSTPQSSTNKNNEVQHDTKPSLFNRLVSKFKNLFKTEAKTPNNDNCNNTLGMLAMKSLASSTSSIFHEGTELTQPGTELLINATLKFLGSDSEDAAATAPTSGPIPATGGSEQLPAPSTSTATPANHRFLQGWFAKLFLFQGQDPPQQKSTTSRGGGRCRVEPSRWSGSNRLMVDRGPQPPVRSWPNGWSSGWSSDVAEEEMSAVVGGGDLEEAEAVITGPQQDEKAELTAVELSDQRQELLLIMKGSTLSRNSSSSSLQTAVETPIPPPPASIPIPGHVLCPQMREAVFSGSQQDLTPHDVAAEEIPLEEMSGI